MFWPTTAERALKSKVLWGLIGWVVFVGFLILMFRLVESELGPATKTAPSPPADSSSGFQRWLWPGFVVLFLAADAYSFWKGVYRNPAIGHGIHLNVTHDAVSSTQGPTHTRLEWVAFDRFVEKSAHFFLHFKDSNAWMLLFKRAIPDPATESAVRELLRSNIGPPTGAFPVIPVIPLGR